MIGAGQHKYASPERAEQAPIESCFALSGLVCSGHAYPGRRSRVHPLHSAPGWHVPPRWGKEPPCAHSFRMNRFCGPDRSVGRSDNGLASLAGALRQAGHDVRIVDYNTLSLIGRLIPPYLRRRLANAYDRFTESRSNRRSRALYFCELKIIDVLLERRQRAVLRELADDLVKEINRQHSDFVGFKLWNGDGFSGSVFLAGEVKRRCPGQMAAAHAVRSREVRADPDRRDSQRRRQAGRGGCDGEHGRGGPLIPGRSRERRA
jgi:hypothetical protein